MIDLVESRISEITPKVSFISDIRDSTRSNLDLDLDFR